MRRLIIATALASLLVAPALAGPYKARGFLRTGYSDRQLGPDRWEVRGSSHDEGGSIPVALYHAAEIANAAGVAELRVVKQKVTVQRMVRRSDGATVALTEKTEVTVQALRRETDRVLCEMPEAARCLTLPVAGILSAYGPRLGMPAARPGEMPALPVRLAASSTGWRFPHATAPLPAGPIAALLRGMVGSQQRSVPSAAASMPSAYVPVPAAAGASPSPAVPFTRPVPLPRTGTVSAEQRYAEALRAAQPVSRDARLGWTASD